MLLCEFLFYKFLNMVRTLVAQRDLYVWVRIVSIGRLIHPTSILFKIMQTGDTIGVLRGCSCFYFL